MARPSKRRYSARGPNYVRNVENRKAAVAERWAAEAGVEATAVFRPDVHVDHHNGKTHEVLRYHGVIDERLLAPDRVHGGIVKYSAGIADDGSLVVRTNGPSDDQPTSKATNKRAARVTRDFIRR